MHTEYIIPGILSFAALAALIVAARALIAAERDRRRLATRTTQEAQLPRRAVDARRKQAAEDAARLSGDDLAAAVNGSRKKTRTK